MLSWYQTRFDQRWEFWGPGGCTLYRRPEGRLVCYSLSPVRLVLVAALTHPEHAP